MAPLLAVLQKLLRPLQPVTMTQLSPKKPQYALHLASSQRRLYSSRVCQLSPRGSFGGLVWRAPWGCSCGCKQTYIGDRRTASHPCATWGGWCSAPFAGISSHMSCIRTCLCHCTVFGNRWKMRYPAIIYQYEKRTTGNLYHIGWNSVKKLRFVYLLQAGERYFSSHFHKTWGPPFRDSLYRWQR